MNRRTPTVAAALLLGAALAVPAAGRAAGPDYTAGSAGVGDPYFPLDGNGGFDVGHYGLDLDFDPVTHALDGAATISATATQGLSRFDLDLDGLTVGAVTVDGQPARWSRSRGELVITPAHGIPAGQAFTTVVEYAGVPEPLVDETGVGGPIPTDDGALFLGEPHVASTWFPVSDHPTDKAAYTVSVTVPDGLEVVGNGALVGQRSAGGRTTWTWDAPEPMASYLATASVGQFDLSAYRSGGLRYWDAVDPDLFAGDVPQPVTGSQYVWSQQTGDGPSYKRLGRVLDVPAAGAWLTFSVDRATELDWDYVFVEAHTVGADDWTTLPDLNGHTGQDTGFSCPWWQLDHPFLAHYQTADLDAGTCTPTGTTGAWWAATGRSDGWEQWRVDLSAYAGRSVEVVLAYASDSSFQERGVFLDDVVVSTGQGSTSFEKGRDVLGGWTVLGAPAGEAPNENDWVVTDPGGVDLPTLGDQIRASFARQPEIIRFLESNFGRYPFATAGGVVDDVDAGFALENQTRPVYSPVFWLFGAGDSVVVHEVAHQWYGDDVAVGRWQDIWLNEGFASYAEWLWAEHEGLGTADEIFSFFYDELFPEGDPFWDLTIGDPGPGALFAGEVYDRGAMTLHVLRRTVGDEAFFTIMRTWASGHARGNGTIPEFVALSEQVSGQELDPLFKAWLFTSGRPALDGTSSLAASVDGARARHGVPAGAKAALARAAAAAAAQAGH